MTSASDPAAHAFAFTCVRCGPVEVVPVTEVGRIRSDDQPARCPRCNGPVSVDVVPVRPAE